MKKVLIATLLTSTALMTWLAMRDLNLVLNILWGGAVVWVTTTILWYRSDISAKKLIAKYSDESSHFVDVDGINVHYQVHGQGEPLVLVHGTIGSTDEWSEWVRILKDSYQVICMDIPGFGLTGPNKSGRYTSEEYVDFIFKFAKAIGLESFHLGGNSLGGHIAWSFAAMYPQMVQTLILVGPSGVPPGPKLATIEMANTPLLSWFMTKITPEWTFRIALEQAYEKKGPLTPDLIKRHYELTRRKGNRKALVDHFKTVRSNLNIDDLYKVQAPTLLLWGKKDRIITWDMHKYYTERLHNYKLTPFENVGHMVIKEIPEVSANVARNFIQATKDLRNRAA